MDNQSLELFMQALKRAEEALSTARQIVLENTINKKASVKDKDQEKPKRQRSIFSESLPVASLGTPPTLSASWPIAIPPYKKVTTELEKQFRAIQIIDSTKMVFDGLNILDFGCGEGHVAIELSKKTNVVGYDIIQHKQWEAQPNTFTTDMAVVKSKGPYDCIIVYDVIDHLQGHKLSDVLRFMSDNLSKNGKIIIRTHPWTSRYGSHACEFKHNYAYIHLAFTADELLSLGVEQLPTVKYSRPMAAYEEAFKAARLKVILKKSFNDPPEPFFHGDILERIIKITWKGEVDHDTAIKIMSNQYIDYQLVVADL